MNVSKASGSQSEIPTSSESSLADAQRIVNTLHEPLLVLDENLVVRQVNPAFYKVFSTTHHETIGKSLFDLGGGHFRHSVLRDPLDRLLQEHESFEGVELDQEFEGLGRRVLRVNGQMLQVNEGTSERVLLALKDVTEQRRLEAKLRRHARELKQSNEDLEQFAYAASHDLQEPLRMVSSYLQLLERRCGGALDETGREFIEYAVDGAERMKSLINGLLQYSRVGRKEETFRRVDLGKVLGDVIDDLGPRIDELNGTIQRGTLPNTYAARNQVRRLFQNLLENALTYCGDASPHIRVSGRETDPGAAHLIVQDEGPGIPEEAQEKVFQIFKQLDPHGTGKKGSGIGLALCKKITERHGGQIWVESEPGAGSAFHVTLNLSPSDVA